jgi:hypothetical protein
MAPQILFLCGLEINNSAGIDTPAGNIRFDRGLRIGPNGAHGFERIRNR